MYFKRNFFLVFCVFSFQISAMKQEDKAELTRNLYFSIQDRNFDSIKKLIDQGADINGEGAFSKAFVSQSPIFAIFELMFEKIDGRSKEVYFKGTDLKEIEDALENGDESFKKAFNSAIESKEKLESEILHYLIANGADINFQDNEKVTPIMYAIKKHKFFGVKILIDTLVDLREIQTILNLAQMAFLDAQTECFKLDGCYDKPVEKSIAYYNLDQARKIREFLQNAQNYQRRIKDQIKELINNSLLPVLTEEVVKYLV